MERPVPKNADVAAAFLYEMHWSGSLPPYEGGGCLYAISRPLITANNGRFDAGG